MKNFVISSVLISVLALATIYLLKAMEVQCFSQTTQIALDVVIVFAMAATMITSFNSFGLRVLAAVSNFAAAYVFACSFIYLNGLYVFETIIPAVMALWIMVDIKDEVEEKERRSFVCQMMALMLAQFIVVSVAIIQLAKM